MFKKILLGLLAGFLLLVCILWLYDNREMFTLNNNETEIYNFDDPQTGNIVGNISQGGFAARKGNWVYYENNRSLFKMKIDGTNITKLCSDDASYINVFEGWIYYVNGSDKDTLYKIGIDGNDRTKLSSRKNCKYANVYDGWIYYAVYNDSGIYKIKTDGMNDAKLSDDSVNELLVYKGALYFLSNSFEINRMKFDGTNKDKIINDEVHELNIDNDQIYFTQSYGGIYKTNLDGSNKIKLVDDIADHVNVQGNWVYYTKEYVDTGDVAFGPINKVRTDGTHKTRVVNDEVARSMNLLGEWIFYHRYITHGDNPPTGVGFYRVKTNGWERTLIQY